MLNAMGLFSTASTFDGDVEKATTRKNEDDWTPVIDICDKITGSSANCKECLKSILKRMQNSDPKVVLQTITLLDACVNNCGKVFHLEVATKEFEQAFRTFLLKFEPKIATRLKHILKRWCETEFKNDPQLSLIPALLYKLQQEGIEFPEIHITYGKSPTVIKKKDPQQQEEKDLARAIELSLMEANQSNVASKSSAHSLYPSSTIIPSNNARASVQSSSSSTKEKRLVKALYDFEALEDNELTFYSGEIIELLDDSYENWWRGSNHRGEGLFPANFVTTDLTVVPEKEKEKSGTKKTHVQFNEDVTSQPDEKDVVIDKSKIDRLLKLLHEANPTDESADTEEMIKLEAEVNAMGPLIDGELESTDMKHAHLTQLSASLVDAVNLYHSLMREPFSSTIPSQLPPLHQAMYNGGLGANYYQLPAEQQKPYANAQLTQSNMLPPSHSTHHQYMTLPNHAPPHMMPPTMDEAMHNHHSLPPQSYQMGVPMTAQYGPQHGYLPSSGIIQQHPIYHPQPTQGVQPSQINTIHQ